MSKHWTDKLVELHACREAVEWAKGYPSLKAAWRVCKRGDWMLWLIGHTEQSKPWSEERKVLARIAVECAMLAPSRCDEYELSRQWCIDALLRWCTGEDNRDEVEASRAAAYSAAVSLYFADGSVGDYCAAAAYVCAAAAYVCASALDPAAAAYAAATYAAVTCPPDPDDAYPDDAYTYTWREIRWIRAAQIVRRHRPQPPRLES